MKHLYALILMLAGLNASASVNLKCDGERNLIFEGVHAIVIDGKDIQLVAKNEVGVLQDHPGYFVQKGHDALFMLSYGVQVSVPQGLLDGTEKTGVVGLATYEYPYESTVCSVQ